MATVLLDTHAIIWLLHGDRRLHDARITASYIQTIW